MELCVGLYGTYRYYRAMFMGHYYFVDARPTMMVNTLALVARNTPPNVNGQQARAINVCLA